MSVWSEEPLINKVYEKLKELSKGGTEVIREVELASALSKDGISVSSPDLSKALLKLEMLGLVRVASSTKDERLIKLLR